MSKLILPQLNRKGIWFVLGALTFTLVSFYPQFTMWIVRGNDWHGAFAQIHGDEWLYSAYLESLIEGRPRRNDPYTGRDDRSENKEPESLFSIQFIPSYLIAIPARVLHLSASSSFILLALICPFVSCLAISWLLFGVTHDYRFSVTASLIVLSFGTLVGGGGTISLFGSGPSYLFVPFLRRYEPAAMFPLLFIFCGCVWRSISKSGPIGYVWAICAGLGLSSLVFSYFYLWTSAAAWLVSVALLQIISNSEHRIASLYKLGLVSLLGSAAIVPYYVLLSHRANIMDSSQQLLASHTLDLFRVPELFALANIGFFVFVLKRRGLRMQPELYFGLSFLLVPFIVFNQQVITGLSLQPYHFEIFSANYLVLTGAVLVMYCVWRRTQLDLRLSARRAFRLIIVALWWLTIELLLHTNTIASDSHFVDQAALVANRLGQISKYDDTALRSQLNPQPLVFAADPKVAVLLPTFAPQALLWSPNFGLINLTPEENTTRFYLFLYYLGVDSDELRKILSDQTNIITQFAFGPGRNLPDVTLTPISETDITKKVSAYSQFCNSLTFDKLATYPLSYLIEPTAGADLTNLDRWYERDAGQQIGPYVLYRVRIVRH